MNGNLDKNKLTKLVIIICFTAVIFGLFLHSILGELAVLSYDEISFTCIVLCAILSVIFVHKLKDNTNFVSVAMLLNIASDYFLVLTNGANNYTIGVSIFVVVQFVYACYTLTLNKTKLSKIFNVVFRVVTTLSLSVTLTIVFDLYVYETLSVIYITNFVITLIYALVYFKNNYIFAVGVLLYVLCDLIVGITFGAADIFGFEGAFIGLLYTHDFAYFFYIPGAYLIALHAALKRICNKK